ncbi:MAG: HEAT repeat domain-containing protein [bacterium]|nr:HEAT repeat domain-containing protein [bacterium]MDD5756344.1 HEAT repeat domain-containing protein [bacterium]
MKKVILAIIIVILSINLTYAGDVDRAISKIHNKETRQVGAKELEVIGQDALPQIQEIAKDKARTRDERITALILMGRIGKNAPVDTEQPPKGQKMMGSQQKHSNRKQVRMQLEDTLKNDDDDLTREASALALGHLKDHDAIPKLKDGLNDRSGNVRMRAALGLAKLGDTDGKAPALQALTQKDVTAQLLAIDVLEEYNEKSVIPQLKKNLKSDNVWTRIHSMLAIKRIEIKELQGLSRLNYLQDTLKDKQFEVNNWAAESLMKEVANSTENRPQALNILKDNAKNNEIAGCYSCNKMLRYLIETGKITESELQ